MSNNKREVAAMDTAVKQDRIRDFRAQVIRDAAAALCGVTVSIGDRLGLYTAIAGAGPLTSHQVAASTALVERYVREWLAVQVASVYIEYNPVEQTYMLPDEQAAVLADPMSPTYLAGAFLRLQAAYATEDQLVDAFHTGAGVGWNEHPDALFSGTANSSDPVPGQHH